jgi:hypothetical protein
MMFFVKDFIQVPSFPDGRERIYGEVSSRDDVNGDIFTANILPQNHDEVKQAVLTPNETGRR